MTIMFRMFRKNSFLFPKTLCHIIVIACIDDVWGYGESASIERILLEVPLNTSTSAVLGELGLYPVWVSTKLKAVQFWNRICERNASVLVLILSCSLGSDS